MVNTLILRGVYAYNGLRLNGSCRVFGVVVIVVVVDSGNPVAAMSLCGLCVLFYIPDLGSRISE